MDATRKECIWFEQCGSDCPGRCPDFSPLDETENTENYYHSILRENTEEYQSMIKEYSHGGEAP